jgi:predicted GH43/DUF377 family glycosyl hydrolase
MPILHRSPQNPILKADPENSWEAFAAFNGSVIKKDDRYYMFYRAMSDVQTLHGKKLQVSTVGKAESVDGVEFGTRNQFIKPEEVWEQFGCEDPRVVKIDNQYLIFYTAIGAFPFNFRTIRAAVAISKDLDKIEEKHLVTPFNAKGMIMFPEKINGLYTVILTVNTDNPPTHIAYAQFEHFETLWDQNFWNDWYEHFEDHIVNLKRINSDQVEVGATPIKTEYGWILIYSYIKNYFTDNKEFRIEAVLLDSNDPSKIIGRIEDPCLIPQEYYELNGQINNVVFPSGALIENNEIKVYYGAADSYCCLAKNKLENFLRSFELNIPYAIKCKKFENNPLLKPLPEHAWESKSVCNPTAVTIQGKTYLIYRATAENNISTLGLAVSEDGIFIDERLPEPIYTPRVDFEVAGCEDPRITFLEGKLYMCYTAYDGKLPRLALTSITVEDFVNREWNKWALPKIISPPGVADKDGCLFPEKINGQYAFFHRIEPNIILDWVDDLEFKDNAYLACNEKEIFPGSKAWDGIKVGVNTTPLKTKYGWLVFYHGISHIHHRYRVGAFLLDLHKITQVVARTPYPIIEPEEYYEREGVVNNVVFPCGYVLKGEDIYIYYGGADKYVCGAKIHLNTLLEYLVKSTEEKYLI